MKNSIIAFVLALVLGVGLIATKATYIGITPQIYVAQIHGSVEEGHEGELVIDTVFQNSIGEISASGGNFVSSGLFTIGKTAIFFSGTGTVTQTDADSILTDTLSGACFARIEVYP